MPKNPKKKTTSAKKLLVKETGQNINSLSQKPNEKKLAKKVSKTRNKKTSTAAKIASSKTKHNPRAAATIIPDELNTIISSPDRGIDESGMLRAPTPSINDYAMAQNTLNKVLQESHSPLVGLDPINVDQTTSLIKQCSVKDAVSNMQYKTDANGNDIRFANLLPDANAPLEMRDPTATKRILEIVLGHDDRLKVSPTTGYVWRCICSLRIKAIDGSIWFGTGWLAGPRLVITAGHVVHIANRGGWVQEIEVTPGKDGVTEPFGSAVSRNFRTVRGWVDNESGTHDYGAIILPPDARFGDQLGFFGVAALDDADLAEADLHLSGYPADKTDGTQWHHVRQPSRLESETIFYDIDTAGGQSGAPVWTNIGGVNYAAGVHRAGQSTGNSAVRFTDRSFDNIFVWNEQAN